MCKQENNMASNLVPFEQQVTLARAFVQSGLFGVKNESQALALMALCEAEGMHPARAVQEFHIVQGRPAMKADAMLARFQKAGGKVDWHDYTDAKVSGTFSHAQGGSVRIEWTFEQAKKIGLAGKDNWKNYPRAMLRARCISEGVRTVFPGIAQGMYTVEETQDMGAQPAKQMGAAEVVTPELPPELLQEARDAAMQGVAAYAEWWQAAGKEKRKLLAGEHESLKQTAADADSARTVDEPAEVPE
jgi:hypothetical protein